MKLDILAVGAHPDDVELGCGGTLAKEINFGKKAGILDLTQGELGTRGTPKMRLEESKKSAEILGISIREQLHFKDGFFRNDEQHQVEIIKIIRQYKPDIVLCNAPKDRHIDHGKGAELVSHACFLSGLQKIDTGQEAWRPKQVYHYIQWQPIEPSFVVDISDYLNIKLKATLAYKSQFYNPDSKEEDTPISSKNFLESISYRAKDLGRIVGIDAAEGFVSQRCVAVNRITELI